MNRRDFGRSSSLGHRSGVRRPALAAAQTDGSRAFRYIHLDVFTDRRLQGNQLFVFTQPAGLDTETMQTMTRESNLSECTFVFRRNWPDRSSRADLHPHRRDAVCRPSDDRHRVRARARGRAEAGHGAHDVRPRCRSDQPGSRLERRPPRLRVDDAVEADLRKTIADGALAAALGLDLATGPGAGTTDPRRTGGQLRVELLHRRAADAKAVDAAVIDRAKVDAVFAAAGIQRRGIYAFSVERAGDDVTAYSRMLPSGGIEDPATGSAVGPAGCFAAKYGFVPRERIGAMTFLQGVLAKRPSRLHVKVAMTGAEVTSVQVGGASVVVGEGSMAV